MIPTVNIEELRGKVKTMYRQVAEDPKGEFHLEMGRALAERLGYPSEDLGRIPAEAIESPVSATTSIWPACKRANGYSTWAAARA